MGQSFGAPGSEPQAALQTGLPSICHGIAACNALPESHNVAQMSGVRIIVLMLIVALGLSGWAAHVQAFGTASLAIASEMGGSGWNSEEAECHDGSASEAHHDHSHPDHGASSCHMISAGLELYAPSAYPPGWYAKAALRPVHADAVTGVSSSPTLRPPRV